MARSRVLIMPDLDADLELLAYRALLDQVVDRIEELTEGEPEKQPPRARRRRRRKGHGKATAGGSLLSQPDNWIQSGIDRVSDNLDAKQVFKAAYDVGDESLTADMVAGPSLDEGTQLDWEQLVKNVFQPASSSLRMVEV